MEPLASVKQPALVIGNDGDPLHPIKIAEDISGALGNAHYEKLPSRYLEAQFHQECLTAELQSFLDETIFVKR